MSYYLNDLGIVNALGSEKAEVAKNLFSGAQRNIVLSNWVPEVSTYVAQISAVLPGVPDTFIEAYGVEYKSRNNQLALMALMQILPGLDELKNTIGACRVAVVIGTSTSGISEAEKAVIAKRNNDALPEDYRYQQIELGSVAEFVAHYVGAQGPAYAISTACSSSGHALSSAKNLLDMNMADVVIVGGVDSLCKLTVNGFAALESVSDDITNPYSVNRKGITIGEGASLFLLSKTPSKEAIELLGVGASSDAHHISAPQPEGEGAERAINAALQNAGLQSDDIDYINLHGTGTRLNDAMESKVVERMFGLNVPCSSSKGQIGHTLGAAAACEVGLCWLSLSAYNTDGWLPPHLWDGERDPALSDIRLVEAGQKIIFSEKQALLSNSFAFGGNNAAVIIGRS